MAMVETRTFSSRAVKRRVQAAQYVRCSGCADAITFTGRNRGSKIIANVYVDGTWDRVEHWHEACYDTAGEPHGPVEG